MPAIACSDCYLVNDGKKSRDRGIEVFRSRAPEQRGVGP
jgi:hypothetical protein